jgi:hypothetical protein
MKLSGYDRMWSGLCYRSVWWLRRIALWPCVKWALLWISMTAQNYPMALCEVGFVMDQYYCADLPCVPVWSGVCYGSVWLRRITLCPCVTWVLLWISMTAQNYLWPCVKWALLWISMTAQNYPMPLCEVGFVMDQYDCAELPMPLCEVGFVMDQYDCAELPNSIHRVSHMVFNQNLGKVSGCKSVGLLISCLISNVRNRFIVVRLYLSTCSWHCPKFFPNRPYWISRSAAVWTDIPLIDTQTTGIEFPLWSVLFIRVRKC